jgi:hypothetical protein
MQIYGEIQYSRIGEVVGLNYIWDIAYPHLDFRVFSQFFQANTEIKS